MNVKRLAFHEALGVLNVGDLHPGGSFVTEFLLHEVQQINPRLVLEVGAGIGCTTSRMLELGWKVDAIEPSDVLRSKLKRRLGISAYEGGFETFEGKSGPYDAVIGESVFYGMDLGTAFKKVHRLLRPGGLFANVDMVWTDLADAQAAAAIHDETRAVFGIPMASRKKLSWSDWKRELESAGFEEVKARKPNRPLAGDTMTKLRIIASAPRHPLAFAQHLIHRLQARKPRVPAGWTETWMSIWRRV